MRTRTPSRLRAAAALAGAAGAAALAAADTGARPDAPTAPGARPAFETRLLPAGERVARTAAATWGGVYTAATGERVNLRFSDAYSVEQADVGRWANFLASLVHGPELERVTVLFAPLAEVRTLCRGEVFACYSRAEQLIVTSPEDASGVPPAQSILAHEYAHHIAVNRANPPWDASNYGTKRWATYMGICAAAIVRQVHPGRNGIPQLNPGEGFAEAYRVLNERRLGLPESVWSLVDRRFYPDERALAALTQDVLEPWEPTTTTRSGTFAATGGRRHGVPLAISLDGVVTARLAAAGRRSYRLAILRGDGLVLTRGGWGETSVERNVCGVRSAVAVVERRAGAGAYRLSVSTP